MFDKLEDILFRYDEVLKELSEPEVLNDASRYQKLMKEQSDLEPIVEKYREYKAAENNAEEAKGLLEESGADPELKELAQTVVSVDNAAVKIIEVARCKASALELNHGTKLRRDNRKHVEDHPLGSVAALSERLDNLKAFKSLGLLLTACVLYLLAQLRGELVEVDLGKKLLDSLGTHACPEIVLIHQAVLVVILLVENLILFKIRCAGIDNDMHRKVENFLKVARRYIEDKTHS